MKFNKNEISMSNSSIMPEGVYAVKVSDVTVGQSRNGQEMYTIEFTNNKKETIRNYMVNNEYFENSLGRMLYSISDAGIEIPDVDFTFDNSFKFLKDKPLYIQVTTQKDGEYAGNSQFKAFLTKERYDKLKQNEVVDDPFASAKEIDVKDDDFPF